MAHLRDERTADDLISDFNIKLGVAVDAGKVLAFPLGGCFGGSNMDVLSDFTV